MQLLLLNARADTCRYTSGQTAHHQLDIGYKYQMATLSFITRVIRQSKAIGENLRGGNYFAGEFTAGKDDL